MRADEYQFHQPRILVIADSEAGGTAATVAVEATGCRVVALLDIGVPRARLDTQAALDGLHIELSRDPGIAGDALLDWAAHVVEREDVAAVVSFPPFLIDHVTARIGQTAATLLVAPDDADRVAAMSIAWRSRPASSLHDVTREVDNIRLRRLADEVSRIARSLSSLSSHGSPPGGYARALQAQLADVQTEFSSEPAAFTPPPMPGADDVRKLIRMRRLRDDFFEAALFADPAWDMLLDLFAARIEGDQVAVSSLCIAAAVPPTTALRWIKTMTDHGIFERHADPNDGRRIFIRLSETSTRAMAEYFQAVRRFEGIAI